VRQEIDPAVGTAISRSSAMDYAGLSFGVWLRRTPPSPLWTTWVATSKRTRRRLGRAVASTGTVVVKMAALWRTDVSVLTPG
jgi:hypothetical protein